MKTRDDESLSEVVPNSWWERFRRARGRYTWPIIGVLWAVALLLGYLGFSKYYAAIGEARSYRDIFYVTLQLFTVESGSVPGPISWELETARLLAPALTLYTAVQALALIFRQHLKRFRLRFYRDHVVICGLGRRGLLLARAFRALGESVVVVEQDDGNDRIEQCAEMGIVVVIGNASDREMLYEARVHTARYLIAMCGDDGVNAEIAIDALGLVKDRGRAEPLHCIVQIVDAQLLRLLRGQEMHMGLDDSIRIEFFNVFERGARAILHWNPAFSESVESPHILVVGMGRMGESLVTHAVRSWRTKVARYNPEKKLAITIVDREADTKREYLRLHYPLIESVCDLTAVETDVRSPVYYRAEFLGQGANRVTAIYICLDSDSRAMAAALALLQRTRGLDIPIVIRMTHEEGLAALLTNGSRNRSEFSRLRPFGILDRICTPDLVVGGVYEIIAHAIHEECVKTAAESREKSHGAIDWAEQFLDQAGRPWEQLPKEIKDAFRRRADNIGNKLAAVGCAIEPLTNWDAEVFRFTSLEEEIVGKLEYREHVEEILNKRWTFFPGYEKLRIGRGLKPTPWNGLSDEARESYRQMVRQLPEFLARTDFQICRLR